MSVSLNEAIKNFNEPNERSSKLFDIIFYIIIVALLVVLLLAHIYSVSRVSGESMMPTVADGDLVICAPVNNIKHGEVVTAKVDDEKIIIKRVVALPNEKIIFKTLGDGKSPFDEAVELYVDKGNGFEKISEEYIYSGLMTEYGCVIQTMFLQNKYKLYSGDISDAPQSYIITLADNEYFLLGDNRDNSTDSRSYGAFCKDDLLGKVVKVVDSNTGLHFILDEILFSAKRHQIQKNLRVFNI